MEKDAAGYPSLPLHYGLMNPGTSRTSPAAYPTSRAVLRGGGGGDVTSLPDPQGSNPLGHPARNSCRGISLGAVQKVLGHDRLTTAQIYLNFTDINVRSLDLPARGPIRYAPQA